MGLSNRQAERDSDQVPVQGGRATVLLLVLLILPVLYHLGRTVPDSTGPPAFFVEHAGGFSVCFGGEVSECEIHQFFDDITPVAAIKMAGLSLPAEIAGADVLKLPLQNGEKLEFSCNGAELLCLSRGWMPAAQRMALGIPLHPDRMVEGDWDALPGVGPKLARRIEMDRQKNGDFGGVDALLRVSGIGPSRLKSWSMYFISAGKALE